MRQRELQTIVVTLVGAAGLGVLVGVGSLGPASGGEGANQSSGTIVATGHEMLAATGFRRRREPRDGDIWGGCNDARAAGTAPIYRDEPGYRVEMDGDQDGIACEPLPY